MTDTETIARGWSVETFRAFWAKPDPSRLPAVMGVLTDDIVGYWPKPIGKVVGAKSYYAVIEAVVTQGAKFSLEVAEHATNGDFTFVRWIATVEEEGGITRFTGCDRLRTRDGKVCENYVFCDHPFFERVAGRVAELA